MSICYLNGKYLPKTRSKISIEDRGLNFSDGIYEVIRFRNKKLLNFSDHQKRLNRSLKELKMKFPFSNKSSLIIVINNLLKMNAYKNGFIYLQITRGTAVRNHIFPKSVKPNIILSLYPEPDVKKLVKGVKVILTEDIRWKRCDIKSTSLLPNVIGKQLAFENGCYESWQTNEKNKITEGTTSNAFIILNNGKIQTHPLNNNILGGVTRNTLIKAARDKKINITEKAFSKKDLLSCEEAFLTSTTVGVIPVIVVNEKKINKGKVGRKTKDLITIYNNFLSSQLANE